MAEVDVKKNQKDDKAPARQSGTELGARNWDPFASWPSPSEFFSNNPFSMMRRFRDDMDRAFSHAFGQETGGSRGTWFPAIEVKQEDGNLKVHAELPGLKPEDVKVEVTNDSLVIQGERKFEHEENKKGVFRSERQYGQFYRQVPLPEGTNADQAKAEFNNGVLEVTLPVPESKSKRREIPIAAATSDRK